VLHALRGADKQLTVIVSIALDAEGCGDPRQRITGAGVGDLRRSLEALSAEDGPLLRAIRRPLNVERLGQHPLGNLALASAAAALGDYGQASSWLGEQLGVEGAVLPATNEPAVTKIESVEDRATGQAQGGPRRPVRMLRFVGTRPHPPEAAIVAIEHAEWVLLAPGALYRSVLSAAAVPDLASAIRRSSARVAWIANLEPDPEPMTAIDQLRVLSLHGIHVDLVLYDAAARLRLDGCELAKHGVEAVSRPLRSNTNPAVHEPEQLRAALSSLIGPPITRPGGSVERHRVGG
jgi:uncharacterized cofD-like protein